MNKTYEATATREGGWWIVRVPELDVSGHARKLAGAEDVARSITALALDVAPDAVVVSVHPQPSAQVAAAFTEADSLAEQGQELIAKAATMRAEAVQEYMRTEELTVRETAAALGVSPGRVQQYLKRGA